MHTIKTYIKSKKAWEKIKKTHEGKWDFYKKDINYIFIGKNINMLIFYD